MYCPYCGVELQDDSIFCHSCGKQLWSAFSGIDEAKDKPIAEEAEIAVMDDQKVQITHIKDKSGQNTKNQAKKPFIIVACLLILIVVALVIILPSNHVKKNAESVLYLELYDDTNTIIGSASGFLIHDDTTLVTNYHVIDGTYHIRVKDANGKKYTTADTILAYDEDLDLAILQCDEGIGVAPLPLGNSAAIKQGDKVFAVGYPLGLANTLSEGIVSSLYSDGGTDTIQTTAAISGGSSGGALLNDRGEVIGVTAASYEDGQNLNLAIPINYVKDLLKCPNNSIQLQDFYALNIDSHSIDDVLQNFDEYEGQEIYVDGWVSMHNFDSNIAWVHCFGNKDLVYNQGNNSIDSVPTEIYNQEIKLLEDGKGLIFQMDANSFAMHMYAKRLITSRDHIRFYGKVSTDFIGRPCVIFTDLCSIED